MKKIVLIVLLVLLGCKDNINNSQTSTNIIVDSKYLKPSGGDPRGGYSPNSPFVFISNPDDSLTLSYGVGKLDIVGSSSTNGTYDLRLTSRIRTKRLGDFYINDTYSDTVSGSWMVSGTNITFTIGSANIISAFSVDSKGFYLIYHRLSTFPPMNSGILFFLDSSSPDSTVWIFKRNLM